LADPGLHGSLHRMPPPSRALPLPTFAVLAFAALLIAATLAMTAARAEGAGTKARAERAVARSVVHKYGVGTRVQVQCARQGKRRFACGFAARTRSDRRTAYIGQARVSARYRVRLGRVVKVRG
jgi:hypothetical protein